MPDATGLELIAQQARDAFPSLKVDTQFQHDQATLIVSAEGIVDVLTWLRDEPSQQYNFLASVYGADYLPKSPRFAVHYQLINMDRAERLGVKVPLDLPAGSGDDLPEVDSVCGLFPSANFQEREVYDMFGINFKGHPDMTRILLPDGYVGWPQRRDFPVGGEPVQFTHNESELGN